MIDDARVGERVSLMNDVNQLQIITAFNQLSLVESTMLDAGQVYQWPRYLA